MSIISDIGSAIKNIIQPVTGLIDELKTTDEEKLKLRNQLEKIQGELILKMLSYFDKLVDAQSGVIEAEAKSESWLTRSWRPMIMVLFMILIVLYWFGYSPENMDRAVIDKLFDIIQLGLGGYIGGRSIEKTVQAFRKK